MRIREIINEAPLTDYEPIGFEKDKPGGFEHEADRRLVTSPVAIGKLQKFLSGSHHDFRLFPVQIPGGDRYLQYGMVSPQELQEIVGDDMARRILSGHNNKSITVVFANNRGANRMPMRAWIMVHRISHAIEGKMNPMWDKTYKGIAKELNDIIVDYYNPERMYRSSLLSDYFKRFYREFFQSIGTMQSARLNLLENPEEFINELFTQYVALGTVEFNPAPKEIYADGEIIKLDDMTQYKATQKLLELASKCNTYFNDLLNDCQGKIFVT